MFCINYSNLAHAIEYAYIYIFGMTELFCFALAKCPSIFTNRYDGIGIKLFLFFTI